MHLKVTLSGPAPAFILSALNSPDMVQKIIGKVLMAKLGYTEINEEDFFLHPVTVAIPRKYSSIGKPPVYGCEVKLNGLSHILSGRKLDEGLEALGKLYGQAIAANLEDKGQANVKVIIKGQMAQDNQSVEVSTVRTVRGEMKPVQATQLRGQRFGSGQPTINHRLPQPQPRPQQRRLE